MTAQRLLLPTLTLLLTASVGVLAQAPAAPPVIPLWPNGAPGFEAKKDEKEKVTKKGDVEQNVSNVHNPSLTVYLPPKEKATGAAIVICPGGGHSNLAIEHEGHNVGKWLTDNGIA